METMQGDLLLDRGARTPTLAAFVLLWDFFTDATLTVGETVVVSSGRLVPD